MDEIVDLVTRSLADETAAEFTERVDEQAMQLRRAIEAGEFDNQAFSVGLEIELYAINAEPDPPEPDEGEDSEAVSEEDLDDDLSGSGADGGSGASLDPDAGGSLESDGSLEPTEGESPDRDTDEAVEDADDAFGPGEGPSLDIDPDSPLADDEPETPNDIADGIQISEPARLDEILHAIETSGGDAIALGENIVENTLDDLHRDGFYVEPTCAVAPALLRKLQDADVLHPDHDVVVPLTGSGLKTL